MMSQYPEMRYGGTRVCEERGAQLSESLVGAFHLTDGLFFQRCVGGSVRMVKRENGRDGAPVLFEITVDASAWASIIASMSFYGEENGGFYRAMKFHANEPLPAGVMLQE